MARRGSLLIVAFLSAFAALAALAQTTQVQPAPVVDEDADGSPAGKDCNDGDAQIRPGAVEVCDGKDNDCDLKTDEPDAKDAGTWFKDGDGDGFGSKISSLKACAAPQGYVADNTDCNDASGAANPTATEVCDGKDNDCDLKTDEPDAADAKTWYQDKDLDRFGNASVSIKACRQPTGYTADNTDCDDARSAVKPGGTELCDNIDNDCDGTTDEPDAANAKTWYQDGDGDGYGNPGASQRACTQPTGYLAAAGDCQDGKDAIKPGAVEVCDEVDNDCDGKTDENDASDAKTWFKDGDGDGFGSRLSSLKACAAPQGYVADNTDCNDTSGAANPTTAEVCDGRDNDCDGAVDEPDATDAKTWYQDKDLDRFGNASVSIKACRQPTGYTADNTDCDDARSAVKPGGTELCDSIDNDCDGTTDENDAANAKTWYQDGDGDGYGNSGASQRACTQPTGYLAAAGDCDDGSSGINPKGAEICDGKDNDCDGKTDEPDASDARSWYRDVDGDGFGSKLSSTRACAAPQGYVADNTDCNDTSGAANPDAEEVCDGRDNDCDGSTDEPDAKDARTWYADKDADRYGDVGSSKRACSQPSGHVGNSDDCDDGRSAIRPGGTELCDGVDNDCDGTTDEPDAANAKTWYQDGDGDRFGARGQTTRACTAPAGYVADARDCDDGSGGVNPDAAEVCDGKDNDCDLKTDEPDATDAKTWYGDLDADGYGDEKVTTRACSQPRGYVADSSDCNPRLGSANPGADERCDGIDNDCDAQIDEDGAVDAKTWFADRDNDRYGDERNTTKSCKLPSGYVADDRDCDDSSDKAFPGGREVCDDLDNDCDGTTDEPDAFGAPTWYADTDGDGFGDRGSTTVACKSPSGFVEDATDCNDRDGDTWPGAPDFCDGQDNNCSVGDERGLVTFTPARGAREDLSPTFAQGAPGKPVSYRVTRPGTLTFCDGDYYTNLELKANGLTVRSLNGKDATRLDGGGAGSVITVEGSVGIQGLTIAGGRNGDSGGGLLVNGGDVNVVDARITGNEATSFGGGLYAQRGTLKLTRTEIAGNKAHSGGGLYGYYAAMVLDDCSVSGNTAVDGGGVYARFSTLDLSGGSVSQNTASSHGGGVELGGATLTCRSNASVLTNTANRGSVVHATEKSDVRSDGCSLGTGQEEIYLDGVGPFFFDPGAVFTCKAPEGCQKR